MITKKSKYHQHFLHDQGLLQILFLGWLFVLLLGLAMNKGFGFISIHGVHSLLPTFSTSQLIISKDQIHNVMSKLFPLIT